VPSARPDGILPHRYSSHPTAPLAAIVILLITAIYGCGAANLPCPTPLSDLDRHREESEVAEGLAMEAEEEAREAAAARAAAARRLAAAREASDSLRAATASGGRSAP